MNIKDNKICKFILDNKLFILAITCFFVLMYYTVSQVIIINDDLPYSMYMRGNYRVVNIVQILKNQISDYNHINARVIPNGIGQFILMYGNSLFRLGNPIILIIGFIYIIKIINENYSLSKFQKTMIFLLISSLFLCIDKLKYLIYWIMGYSNYCLLFSMLAIYIYYYLKNGLNNNYLLNLIFVLFLTLSHESLLVFFIIFIIGNIVKDYVLERKISKKYIGYIIVIIISSLFIFLSPGNQSRSSTWYDSWNSLNWFGRLNLSIPAVSKNVFEISLHNLVSTFYILVLLIRIFKSNNLLVKKICIVTIPILVVSLILNNGWIYFIIAIIMFFLNIYLYYEKEQYDYVIICVSFFAIAFSMILTPEYMAGRPNYFLYLYFILASIMLLYPVIPKKSYLAVCLLIIMISVMCYGREIVMFNYIGNITKSRYKAIENYKKGKTKEILYPAQKKYNWAVTESNSPADTKYWAYKHFCNYYHLKQDTPIKLVK